MNSQVTPLNNIHLQTRLDDQYSDVTIIFVDGKREISMNLHRNILAWQIPYFDTLFSFAENLSKNKFTVQVEDASVAELLILSFYGQTVDWIAYPYIFLQMIKLKSFLLLDVNLHVKELCHIKIQAEHFTLFLQTVSLAEIEINKNLLRNIRKNIPVDYKWEGVNEEFKEMVLDKKVVCNERMISASDDKTLKLWDVATGACVRTYTGHTGHVSSVVLTEDNQRMISASDDMTLKLWDLATGACLQTYTGHTNSVYSVVLTEDNQRMISASGDNTLKLWDVATGACLQTYTGHTDWVRSVVLTEDNQRMISASDDKTLKLWDVATGACLKTYTGHTHYVMSVVLTEDNQRMISASWDKTLKLWDVATGACLQTYTGHTNAVYSVVLTEDNQGMISASWDKTLKIWDVATGACLQTYTGHTLGVWSVALTKDLD